MNETAKQPVPTRWAREGYRSIDVLATLVLNEGEIADAKRRAALLLTQAFAKHVMGFK